MSDRIKGRCPSCDHESLFVANGGYITCSIAECLNPTLASDLLEQGRALRVRAERGEAVTHIEQLREQLRALLEAEPFTESFARFFDRLCDGRTYPQDSAASGRTGRTEP